MLIPSNHSYPSLQFEPTVLHPSMPSLQKYHDRVPKRKSKEKLETQALDETVSLSHRLLSALIIQDGSETADSIAKLQDELSQFSSKYSQHTLEERISLELQIIGLPMDAVGDQENNDSSHKGGARKAGKQAGLDIAKQTGQSCFNEHTSSDVVLSELVCSTQANCVDDIGSGTAANANVDSHDRQLGPWVSGSSGATPINEKPALAPKGVVITDTGSVLKTVRTLKQISPNPKRKRTTLGRKPSEVRNTTSANAGSSSPSNGRDESKTKTKPKRKMDRLLSLGSGLECMKETSLVCVKQKKSQKKNTKAKSSAQAKTKAKEKVDLGSIAETPSSWSPSKGESGDPVNTGGTGVNKEAGFVFPPDGYLDLDGLSSLEIPDDIDSWPVEPADLVAFLEIAMDDLLDVNRCFRRK